MDRNVPIRANMENSVGPAIRKARIAAKMGGRELARTMKISAGYLCDIEHGRRAPSIDVLARLPRHLWIETAWLDQSAASAWLTAKPGAASLIRALREADLTDDALEGLQRHVESFYRNRCAAAHARCIGG